MALVDRIMAAEYRYAKRPPQKEYRFTTEYRVDTLLQQVDDLPDIVLSDWNTLDIDDMSYIKNKPNVPILDLSGLIPASYLPSYVDDILEYPSFHDLPQPGEPGKIYVTTDNDLTYRWSGTTYIEISKSIITGVKGDAETDYRIGNVNLTAANIGLGNVVNLDLSKAIKGITRNGLTFTYTCLDGTTGTFDQQDNNTTYTAGTGLSLTNTTFALALTKKLVTDALGYTPPTTDHTYSFDGVSFTSGQSTTGEHNANNITSNGVWYYTSNGPETTLGATTPDGALYSQAYSTAWVGLIAQDYRNGRLFVRGKNNNSWLSWLRVALTGESLPASDVYAWAKASTKPSYAFNEISAGTATIGDGTNYILLRSNASWRGGVYWHTTGNEAMVFGNKNSASSFIFANTDPVDRTQWNTLSPWMQIKKGCVYINSLIENGVNPSYNLYVNGTANITGQLDVTGAINTDSYINCTKLNAVDDVTISKGTGAARLRISNAGVLNANNVIEFSQDNSGNTKHFQLQDRMDSGNTRRYFSIWGYNYGSLISASCASGSSYCCVGIGGGNSLLWDTTAKLYVNGNAKASAWNTTSDIRLKDIKGNTNVSIETIANAPLFYFYWKDKLDENKHVGTSAQYWLEVLPEVVSGTDESKFAVDYGVTALTSAITVAREVVKQDKKIKLLEEENKQLKEELLLLKSQINDILTTINKSTNNE